MTILFLLLLCIFLVISLGINYSNIFSQTVSRMKTYKPTPISSTKYNKENDYYLDASATQGVFSNTVNLYRESMISGNTEETNDKNLKKVDITEPTTELKDYGIENKQTIPVANTETWDKYSGPKGSEYKMPGNTNTKLGNGRNGNIYTGLTNETNLDAFKSIDLLKRGGCVGTQYGCCPDGETSKNMDGSNCQKPIVGGCAGTQYGCCPDNITTKNEDGSCNPIKPKGGCEGTQYGCCPDGITSKNADGSNCLPAPAPTDGCAGTQYGCCPDNVTAKNADGSNCAPYPPPGPAPSPCESSSYGCCLDGKTAKNADGSNCSTFNVWKYFGSNLSGIAASGPNNSGYIIKGPNGNIYAGTTSNCAISPYGCCPDNVTTKNADGSSCGNPMVGGCAGTQYGCCPDGVTAKNANGSNCMPAPTPVGCAGTQYGCCPDGVTAKNADGSNCSSIGNLWKYTGPNVTVYGGSGPNNSGFVATGPQGNIFNGSTLNCNSSPYGCCADNVTFKNADGSNCPQPLIGGCAGTQYGCCSDNKTAKNAEGSNCSTYPPPPVQPITNTVFIPPPKRFKVKNYDKNTETNYNSNDNDNSNNETVPQSNNSSCPQPTPCPPCGRCPEPSFDCKKVPNYASTNSEYLPMPVLSDFSQFGM